HGLRRRLAEDSQPYQRWACARYHAPLSGNQFWKTLYHPQPIQGWCVAGRSDERAQKALTKRHGFRPFFNCAI
ncbi:hypothetical protein, partial [Prosthecobacter sp.]|uniref:hypothetical protein n=1 Tax=Prosthecobacter sp. TaxID=1965333 RepID=UPI0024899996